MAINFDPRANGHLVSLSVGDCGHPRFTRYWKRGVRQVFTPIGVVYARVPLNRKWRGDNRSNHLRPA